MKIEAPSSGSVAMPAERNVPRTENVNVEGSVTEAVRASVAPVKPSLSDFSEGESLSDMRRKTRAELNMNEKEWIALIERANKAINGANKSFEYSIHEATKQIMVKVIDKDTKEVIREIPSEKILDMVAKMWELNGLFVDERR